MTHRFLQPGSCSASDRGDFAMLTDRIVERGYTVTQTCGKGPRSLLPDFGVFFFDMAG